MKIAFVALDQGSVFKGVSSESAAKPSREEIDALLEAARKVVEPNQPAPRDFQSRFYVADGPHRSMPSRFKPRKD